MVVIDIMVMDHDHYIDHYQKDFLAVSHFCDDFAIFLFG